MGWLTDYIEKLSLVDYATEKLNPCAKTFSISLEALQPEVPRSLLCRTEGTRQGSRRKIRAGEGAAEKDVCGAGKTARDAKEVGR